MTVKAKPHFHGNSEEFLDEFKNATSLRFDKIDDDVRSISLEDPPSNPLEEVDNLPTHKYAEDPTFHSTSFHQVVPNASNTNELITNTIEVNHDIEKGNTKETTEKIEQSNSTDAETCNPEYVTPVKKMDTIIDSKSSLHNETIELPDSREPEIIPMQPTPSETTQAKDLFDKSTVFNKLFAWEYNRSTRRITMDKLLDPLLSHLTSTIQASNEANQTLLKYFKNQAKYQNHTFSKMRKHTLDPPAKTHPSESFLSSQPSFDADNPTLDTVSCQSPLNVFPSHSFNVLFKFSSNDSTYHLELAEFIEGPELLGSLTRVIQDFQEATATILLRINESRQRLLVQTQEVEILWNHLQKKFIKNEKNITIVKNTFNKEIDTEEFNDKPSDGSKDQSSITQMSAARNTKDCWLYERRYINSCLTCYQMQTTFLDILKESLCNLQHLENWRSFKYKNYIFLFVKKYTAMLQLLAEGLGDIHYTIDPKEYLILKKAQNLEVSHSMDSQDTEKNQTMEIKQEVENTVVYQGKNPHEIQTQESNEIQHYFKLILREDVQNVLSQLTELIKSGQPPESSFSVHISHVRRTAGYFGKWSEGLLVLTWDRWLHMFRAYDDIQPLWSVFVPLVDIRVTEEPVGLKTIELKDKSSFLNVFSQRSYYFRAVSTEEHNYWLECLQLASTADDYTYRSKSV